MRISSALVLTALAGCGRGAEHDVPQGERIACALSGAAAFANDCIAQRVVLRGKVQVTVRHPDGGFRRFDVLKDGGGIASADGADLAAVKVGERNIEVAVGPDRYRFPATVTHAAQ